MTRSSLMILVHLSVQSLSRILQLCLNLATRESFSLELDRLGILKQLELQVHCLL